MTIRSFVSTAMLMAATVWSIGCSPAEPPAKSKATSAATASSSGTAEVADSDPSPADQTNADDQPESEPASSIAKDEENMPADEPDVKVTETVPSPSADEPEAGADATRSAPGAADATAKTAEDRPLPKYLEDVALIPREKLFGNPDKAAARISPDGKHLAFLAPVDGVLNVWVAPLDDLESAKPVTEDKVRGIRSYFWAFTNQHIIYLQDTGGNENTHVYKVDVDTATTTDLTPFEKVRAQIEGVSHRFPSKILVGLNDRDERYHDIYEVDLETGERTLLQENKEGFAGFLTDEDFKVRFAMKMVEEGDDQGNELVLQPDGEGGWKEFLSIPQADTLTTSPAGFNKAGDVMYLIDSRGRDTGALTSYDLASGEQTVIAENDKADIGGALSHPTENTILAVSFNYDRKKWQVFDEEVKQDLEVLREVADGDVEITSQTLDNQLWTVAFLMDDGPIRFYVYDRGTKKAQFLFTSRKDMEDLDLVKMHPVIIKSRDDMDLVSYLTLPPGCDSDGDQRPEEPLPMILDVHGGPWARDAWGFSSDAQLWANRGYAVLSVNFRGSTGFGKAFVNAGNKEWAGKMHDDLLDAVDWAVQEKIADASRVAIMGGSYGGYATLVGLTKTPEVFACGVDIVGPSNIITLLKTVPPYWKPAIQMFRDRVGDFTTEEGQKFLEERSPLNFVENIKRPLLIGQGANDPRVKQSEADQIVKAMQDKNIPVTYVLYPDEGHGFARPENNMSFIAVTEAFLAEHLGGRYQPIGEAFTNSTITVPTGAEQVPGLADALPAAAPADAPATDAPASDEGEPVDETPADEPADEAPADEPATDEPATEEAGTDEAPATEE